MFTHSDTIKQPKSPEHVITPHASHITGSPKKPFKLCNTGEITKNEGRTQNISFNALDTSNKSKLKCQWVSPIRYMYNLKKHSYTCQVFLAYNVSSRLRPISIIRSSNIPQFTGCTHLAPFLSNPTTSLPIPYPRSCNCHS